MCHFVQATAHISACEVTANCTYGSTTAVSWLGDLTSRIFVHGPFSDGGLNEPFGLAVRSGRVGFCPDVLEFEVFTSCFESA